MNKIVLTLMIGVMTMCTEARTDNAELLAIKIIAKFEGFEPEPYICPGGHKTIGYGFMDPELVAKGKITVKEADRILGKMVRSDLRFINSKLPGLTVKQQAAVCSFVHNFGRQGLLDSTYYKRLKEGDFESAKKELMRWVHVKKWDKTKKKYVPVVLDGLVARREYESRWL